MENCPIFQTNSLVFFLCLSLLSVRVAGMKLLYSCTIVPYCSQSMSYASVSVICVRYIQYVMRYQPVVIYRLIANCCFCPILFFILTRYSIVYNAVCSLCFVAPKLLRELWIHTFLDNISKKKRLKLI